MIAFTDAPSNFRTVPISGNPIEMILLGVGVLITLLLIIAFIIVMVRAKRKE